MQPRNAPRQAPPPDPAVLFCGLLCLRCLDLAALLGCLSDAWGGLEFVSAPIPFSYTTYYDDEMGGGLVRRYLTFQRPVPQEGLVELKEASRAVESAWVRPEGGRAVNIDPGVLLPERLVLATTKPAPHRHHLGRGVYADLTLLYRDKSYRALPWTYPDYAAPETVGLLNRLRVRHLTQRRWRAEGEPS